ncbi:MAG: TetR/AcrR family transcriptional regulator [Bacteroidota bacterium]|nr:TetR/AcrR family transcriptional regulator [Bacteroidota bacterium]
MVLITHGGENTEKIANILKVAQKRFGLYGLGKTTMKEIAADLNMSKAALYYYFPDKESLFKMVVEIEQDNFFDELEANLRDISDPIEMLKCFIKNRLDMFKSFFNLSRLRFDEFREVKPLLCESLAKLKLRETEITERILTKGRDIGLFHIEDPNEMALLFLDILRSVRGMLIHYKEFMYLEPEDYAILEKKQNELTEIFIRAMKYKE